MKGAVEGAEIIRATGRGMELVVLEQCRIRQRIWLARDIERKLSLKDFSEDEMLSSWCADRLEQNDS